MNKQSLWLFETPPLEKETNGSLGNSAHPELTEWELQRANRRSVSRTTSPRSPRRFPGGGYAMRAANAELQNLEQGLNEVPSPPILTAPDRVSRAIAYNDRTARSLGWGTLRDQIEVNLLNIGRTSPRLNAADFAQAIALFQQRQGGLTVDGMLGPLTWNRMKTIRVERDPFPRNAIGLDFNVARSPGSCELYAHPGIDIDVAAGTPIPVVADGIVVYAGDFGSIRTCAEAVACQNGTGTPGVCNFLSYGRVVIVEHPNRGAGNTSVYTLYAHVQFRNNHRVNSGEQVKAGRIIAEVGSGCVGFSSGPHLHYVVVSGPRTFRLRAGGPARCQICASDYCRDASCSRCNFPHFWDLVTPQRPRTTIAPAFQW